MQVCTDSTWLSSRADTHGCPVLRGRSILRAAPSLDRPAWRGSRDSSTQPALRRSTPRSRRRTSMNPPDLCRTASRAEAAQEPTRLPAPSQVRLPATAIPARAPSAEHRTSARPAPCESRSPAHAAPRRTTPLHKVPLRPAAAQTPQNSRAARARTCAEPVSAEALLRACSPAEWEHPARASAHRLESIAPWPPARSRCVRTESSPATTGA